MLQVTACAARHGLGAPDQNDQELGVQHGPVQQHVGSGDVESSLAGEPFVILVEHVFTIAQVEVAYESQIPVQSLPSLRENGAHHLAENPEGHYELSHGQIPCQPRVS